MKKYLSFDLEIAFNFDRISTDLFPPEDGEQVLLLDDTIEGEATWVEATYIGNIIKRFRLPTGELVKRDHWKYQGGDWKRFRPLGITCAAAMSSDGGLWNWHAHQNGLFVDKMDTFSLQNLVVLLIKLSRDHVLLTWNGLGFDFDVLAEESKMPEHCKELALEHTDMMFHFFASKGYPLGLDAAAKGMKLPGKPEGMSGAKAPALWEQGEYHKVLDYVSWDAKNTLNLAQAVDESGSLNWTARSGRPNSWPCERWLTIKEAMELPEPDNDWLDDPWPRSKFCEWTGFSPPPIVKPAPNLYPGGKPY